VDRSEPPDVAELKTIFSGGTFKLEFLRFAISPPIIMLLNITNESIGPYQRVIEKDKTNEWNEKTLLEAYVVHGLPIRPRLSLKNRKS
jgi:hypothetical protein